MFSFFKKLFRRDINHETLLKEYGVTKEQLKAVKNISVDIEVDKSKKINIDELNQIKDLEIEKGPSHMLGLEILSLSSDVWTMIIALSTIARFVGKHYFVTITGPTGKQKVSLEYAIRYFIKSSIDIK